MFRAIFILSFALFLFTHTGSAVAHITSSYTKLNLEACPIVARYEAGATWKCAGYNGIPVYVSEGDLRISIQFGAGGRDQVRWQSFSSFNRVHHTLEWRIDQRGGASVPFATILRWFVEPLNGNGREKQVLVVSRLEGVHSCHVAYIDANANPNANELARRAADQFSRNFRCSIDRPRWVGKVSRNAPRPSG